MEKIENEQERQEKLNYEALSSEQAEAIERNFLTKIKEWHDIAKPDTIAVTATSAVGYGIMVKRVYQKAYGHEPQPAFIIIDPRRIEGNSNFTPSNGELPLKMGETRNSVVLVYDECTTSDVDKLMRYHPRPESDNKALEIIEDGDEGQLGTSALFSSAQYIKSQGAKEVWIDSTTGNEGESLHLIAKEFPIISRAGSGNQPLDFFDFQNYQLSRTNIDRSRAISFLHDLKLIADRISEQIIAQL